MFSKALSTLRTIDRRSIAAAALVLIGLGALYHDVIVELVRAWTTDDNYSHGFFIIPVAAYFAWERRARFAATPHRPNTFGLVIIVGSILVLAAGTLGAEFFLTRISLLGTLVGILLFLFGWARVWVQAFPLAFLLLMIPLPAIIFNQIAFPLQLLASQFGETVIRSAEIPVLREGNVLVLANISLEVAEACSGIRSLISLLTLGLVFGYLSDSRTWVRTVIALSTIPVAIASNAFRVAGTGLAAHWMGAAAAEGFFHEFSGWLVFVLAFVMMMALYRVLVWIAPAVKESKLPVVAAAA